MLLVPSWEDERWKCLFNWNFFNAAKNFPIKTIDINDSCSVAFGFSFEITGMWVEILNVINFTISWRCLLNREFNNR